MSKSPVSLTFDDGLKEQYTKFYPILDEYDLKATFYVVTQRINRRRLMSWDDLKILHKDGNEIGSHTHTHPHLTALSDNELDFEFNKSCDVLRAFNCSTLSYPYGEYNDRVVEHAKKYFAAARGYHNSNIQSEAANPDLNQERYRLQVFPTEQPFTTKGSKALRNRSLFGLPLLKFKQALKELLEYNMQRNAWSIFVIHGTLYRKGTPWMFEKSKKLTKLAVRVANWSRLTAFAGEKALRNDKVQKFESMCEHLAQDDQIEVLPVCQVIKERMTH